MTILSAQPLGRRKECESLDALLARARGGQSTSLVLRGEAGIGKTELLKYVRGQAEPARVVATVGVQSEMELSYAALHQFCTELLPGIHNLPDPQRDALRTAFGMQSGRAPDRFLVGLATLNLLAEASANGPLVCLVDDAQWLDRASALTFEFVARRLLAESILLVLAVREPSDGESFAGLEELVVRGLSEQDSRALLDSVLTGPMDDRVRDRVVAESRGNPLALIELPRGMVAAEIAGDIERTSVSPVVSQLEHSYLLRIRSLPEKTQQLLLAASAEPVGDVTLLRRAAEGLGIDVEAALSQPEAAELVGIGTSVRFRHPLVRSAVYRGASPADLRVVHGALAEATDPEVDPDRRVWHQARASNGPDETVACELEHAAERARARGGVATAAAFLERAAELTVQPDHRGKRTLAAAQAKYEAGAFDAALHLVAAADLAPLDELSSAQLTLLRGQINFTSRSEKEALPMLLEAARLLGPLDGGLARTTHRDAIHATLIGGQLPTGSIVDVARSVLAAPIHEPSREDRLLTGLARVTVDGYSKGAAETLKAVAEFRGDDVSRSEDFAWLPLACRLAHDMWDFESHTILSNRLVETARATGELYVLPLALIMRLSTRVHAGDLRAAAAIALEAEAIDDVIRVGFLAPYCALLLESARGREEETLRAIRSIVGLLGEQPKMVSDTQHAAAVLYNGLGRYEEALDAARAGVKNVRELGLSLQSMVELVEAAVRLGRPEEAVETAELLGEMAAATGTDWATGHAARARGLLGAQDAEASYLQALKALGDAGTRMDLARTHLVYGEWLRRGNRRTDARVQLQLAHQMLDGFGADAFAERARLELQAAGVVVSKPNASHGRDLLTAKEAHIAHLAAGGLTNPEIGAQLYLSRHTVEWHLRKVYAKLGIGSRQELGTALR